MKREKKTTTKKYMNGLKMNLIGKNEENII